MDIYNTCTGWQSPPPILHPLDVGTIELPTTNTFIYIYLKAPWTDDGPFGL